MTSMDPSASGPSALLRQARLVPVLTINSVEHAVPLARALLAGGIGTLEITLRTSCGAAAAAAIRDEVPEAIVGLGTVLNARDLDLCFKENFHFAFSPGASPALLDAAAKSGIRFVPGVQTASEIMACLERGFDVMKFFPAAQAGGIPVLKSLAGPFPTVKFCPTGGITETQASDWLKLPNVLAVGGSWLAPSELMDGGDWEAITARAKKSMDLLAGG